MTAPKNQLIDVFLFDEAGYFAGVSVAMESPLEEGVFIYPPKSTTVEPELNPENFYRWDGEVWVAEPKPTKPEDFVGKWKAGLDAEYDMNIMKITAGISAEQRVEKDAKVKLGLNAAVETSSLIPGATLKLAWADAKDILKSENDNTKELGKITASIKMTF